MSHHKHIIMQQKACYDYSWKQLPSHVFLRSETSTSPTPPISASVIRTRDLLVPSASPIIAISTFCAQGFLRPFEKRKPLLLQEREGMKRRDRAIWHGGRKTCCVQACMHISAAASVHVHVSIWTIVCLFEFEYEWHSCSKRRPTGSGICERRHYTISENKMKSWKCTR